MADGTGESQHSALRLGLMQSFWPRDQGHTHWQDGLCTARARAAQPASPVTSPRRSGAKTFTGHAT
jgi:hypothetical protein